MKNYELSLKLRGLSDDTLKAYTEANKKFLSFTNKHPKHVTTNDIKKYINHLIDNKKKPKTVNLIIAALKSYYDEYLGRRLFTKIKRLKLEKNMPVVLSKQEIKDMIVVASNFKHRLIIKFLYSTGVRVGELVNARVEDLDLVNGYLRIISGKGKKDRITIISKDLCKELQACITENQEYIFPNKRGGGLTRRAVQAIIDKASKKAGIKRKIFPHALRASFATHLYNEGTQIQKIQKLLGHSDYKTTMGYTRTAVINISDVSNPLDCL